MASIAPSPTLTTPASGLTSLLDRMSTLSDKFTEWGAATHATRDYPHREMNALRDEGFFGVTLNGSPLAGGQSNTPALLQLLKLVGRGNLSAGRIYEGHINALELIRLYGNEEQQNRYADEAKNGKLFGVWNTEMGDGIHLHQQTDGSVQMEGSKSFCSGSVQVKRPIVTGILHGAESAKGRGWQMTIPELDRQTVPIDTSFWTPVGMQNSVSYKIDFTGLMLDQQQLLGCPDEYEIQPHFSGGAIRFAAVQLGAAEALLDATVRFLRKVNRTGNAYQRTRVGQMAILVESGNQWLQRAGEVNDQESDTDKVITMANMTRTAIAEICIECLQLAERCVGSRGLMHPGCIARIHTDLSMYLRQPAPDSTLEQVGEYYLNHDRNVHHHWN